MSADVVAFTIEALGEMNFDVSDADSETVFGPAGVDVDSLGVAQLALRVEDTYGVRFGEEDMERVVIMTLGEFAAEVSARSSSLDGASK